MSKEPKFKIGDMIRWASQAGGAVKVKRGKVIAILPSNRDLYGAVPKGTPRSRVMGSSLSLGLRYVVEVPYAGKDTGSHVPPRYYAPLVKTIDGDSDSRGHLEVER